MIRFRPEDCRETGYGFSIEKLLRTGWCYLLIQRCPSGSMGSFFSVWEVPVQVLEPNKGMCFWFPCQTGNAAGVAAGMSLAH